MPPPADTPRADADGYTLLDAGHGERLEQWGPYRLRRPDPRATMEPTRSPETWTQIHAQYVGEAGHGEWKRHRELPDRWTITHAGLTLVVKLAPFKHTGVFPEQAEHWRWMKAAAGQVTAAAGAGARAGTTADERRPLRVLNLFAYTGGATMTLAKAGHHVTHVDASKPAIAWAKENAAANGLATDAVRWIQDDAATFVRREVKRAKRYDATILDPPAFGRTPDGHLWRLHDDLPALLADIAKLLEDPVFVLINDYSRDADPDALASLIESALRRKASRTEAGTLRLMRADGRPLDTGAFVRWQPSQSRHEAVKSPR